VNRPIHAEFEAWSLCLDVQRDLHLQLFSLQRILPAGQNQLQRYLSGNYGIETDQLPVIQAAVKSTIDISGSARV
jgi:hypothetical protein